MDTKKRMFIVSFGNSREYKLEVADTGDSKALMHKNPLEEVETEIKEFLTNRFPGETFAYYETPKVTEVSADDTRFTDFPELNQDAVKEIEKVLVTQIEVRDDDSLLDRNAPFDNLN